MTTFSSDWPFCLGITDLDKSYFAQKVMDRSEFWS